MPLAFEHSAYEMLCSMKMAASDAKPGVTGFELAIIAPPAYSKFKNRPNLPGATRPATPRGIKNKTGIID